MVKVISPIKMLFQFSSLEYRILHVIIYHLDTKGTLLALSIRIDNFLKEKEIDNFFNKLEDKRCFIITWGILK